MDPMLAMARYQSAMLTGWSRMWAAAFHQYGQFWKLQGELLRHHPMHRWHAELSRNADLGDHYGRRARDVDVEHL